MYLTESCQPLGRVVYRGVDEDEAPEHLTRPLHVAAAVVEVAEHVPLTEVPLLGVAERPRRHRREERDRLRQLAAVRERARLDEPSLGEHVARHAGPAQLGPDLVHAVVMAEGALAVGDDGVLVVGTGQLEERLQLAAAPGRSDRGGRG